MANLIIAIILVLFNTILVILLLGHNLGVLINKVPFVPSKQKTINQLLEQIPLPKNSKIWELGCGDGRLLFTAESKFGHRGIGFENSPLPYILAKIRKLFLKSKIEIRFADFMKESFKNAKVIYCYLFPEPLEQIAEKMQKECPKGSLLISNTFKLKNKKPYKIINVTSQKAPIYLYLF